MFNNRRFGGYVPLYGSSDNIELPFNGPDASFDLFNPLNYFDNANSRISPNLQQSQLRGPMIISPNSRRPILSNNPRRPTISQNHTITQPMLIQNRVSSSSSDEDWTLSEDSLTDDDNNVMQSSVSPITNFDESQHIIEIIHQNSNPVLIETVESDDDDDDIPSKCSICLSKYELKDKKTKLPCDHLFHEKCITNWLIKNNNKKCPLCRRVVKKIVNSTTEFTNRSSNLNQALNF